MTDEHSELKESKYASSHKTLRDEESDSEEEDEEEDSDDIMEDGNGSAAASDQARHAMRTFSGLFLGIVDILG